jgi:integrase
MDASGTAAQLRLATGSDDGVPLENIARLVGHQTTTVTETVYRKQLRLVIEDAATSMNRIFPPGMA